MNDAPPFRADLQGLRAIAVLLVIVAHSNLKILPGGFVGVDVFFVLSGYLITGLLYTEVSRNQRIDLIGFYARRFKRLLPALALMLVTVFTLASLLLSGLEVRAQLGSAPYAATWTSNLFFALTQVDYFDELLSKDLFLHTWSLGVEEQFYLIWPVLMLAGYRLAARFGRKGRRSLKVFIGAAVAAMVLSFAFSLYLLDTHPRAAFYMMPSRLWQFSVGALVFLLGSRRAGRRSDGSAIAAWALMLAAGLGAIFWSAYQLNPETRYPGVSAILPTLGTALILAAGEHKGLVCNPLNSRALVWLGDRSYALYLWHWPVFILGFTLGFDGQPLYTFAMFLIALLAAVIAYNFVEYPFWKGRYSHFDPRLVVAASLLSLVLFYWPASSYLSRVPDYDVATQMASRWETDKPIIYRMGCDTWVADYRVVPCEFGDADASKTVVLLGDSIAAQWFTALPAAFPADSWRLVVLTKSSCPIVDEDNFELIGRRVAPNCSRWRKGVVKELRKIRPDVLVVGNSAAYQYSRQQWIEGSRRMLDQLAQIAGQVIVIAGTPSLGISGPGCLTRLLSDDDPIDPERCHVQNRLAPIEKAISSLRQVTGDFANVHLLDLNDRVCPGGTCRAALSETSVVFRDTQHLTKTFVTSVGPLFRERVEGLLGVGY